MNGENASDSLGCHGWLLLSLGASSFLLGLDSFAMGTPVFRADRAVLSVLVTGLLTLAALDRWFWIPPWIRAPSEAQHI